MCRFFCQRVEDGSFTNVVTESVGQLTTRREKNLNRNQWRIQGETEAVAVLFTACGRVSRFWFERSNININKNAYKYTKYNANLY